MRISARRREDRRSGPSIFDREGAVAGPTLRDLALEGRALVQDFRRFRSASAADAGGWADLLPRGDGHPVLVLPAFFCSDSMTRHFRGLLSALGYSVEGWGAGVNIGPTDAALAGADAALLRITDRYGRPASLVGHSLGGVVARALAAEHPARVRRVVTLCSPFRLPTASPLEPVFRALSPWHTARAAMLARLASPPPVPTTALYTREDGVVAWTSCLDDLSSGVAARREGPERENIEVAGAHSTMLASPGAVRIVAERLARPAPIRAPLRDLPQG